MTEKATGMFGKVRGAVGVKSPGTLVARRHANVTRRRLDLWPFDLQQHLILSSGSE